MNENQEKFCKRKTFTAVLPAFHFVMPLLKQDKALAFESLNTVKDSFFAPRMNNLAIM